jgi:hypothetical protein
MVCQTFLFALRSYPTLTGASSEPSALCDCTRTLFWQSLPRLNWSVGMSPLDPPCWYELVSMCQWAWHWRIPACPYLPWLLLLARLPWCAGLLCMPGTALARLFSPSSRKILHKVVCSCVHPLFSSIHISRHHCAHPIVVRLSEPVFTQAGISKVCAVPDFIWRWR